MYPTAGAYRLRLADFEFPQPLQTKGFAATQNGVLLASLNSAGTLDLANVAAGRLFIVALAQPPAGSPSGLLGLDLAPAAAGVGAAVRTHGGDRRGCSSRIASRSRRRANTRRRSATCVSRRNSRELAAVVSRGAERQGSVFAGGTFPFTATAGDLHGQHRRAAVAGRALRYVRRARGAAPRGADGHIHGGRDFRHQRRDRDADLDVATTATPAPRVAAGPARAPPTGTERTAAITASTTFTLELRWSGWTAFRVADHHAAGGHQ